MEILIKRIYILTILMIHISRYISLAIFIKNKESLELVAVVHRHGDRTPLEFYENDPYKDVEKYWPIGVGQLSNRGKLQLYNLGKTLRKDYKTFIPRYSTQAVRVNSSSFDRTLMSAASLLAGMFPPIGDQIWNYQLLWQPIPVHSTPLNKDMILSQLAPCPRYWEEYAKVITELAKNVTQEDEKLFEYLTKYTGQNISSYCDVGSIYTTLLVEDRNGLTLPKWTSRVYPDQLLLKTEMCVASYTWNSVLKRFFGGPLVKEILHQFEKKSTGHIKDMKLFLYSSHDSTVVSLLRALDFKGLIYPDFGASAIFELHLVQQKYYVKMFYSNFAESIHFELDIPSCSTPCPLDELLKTTEYVRSVDWETQCFE